MKKNNSLLLTILGGAVFCFVFLGMAFLSTNNTKNMKGNSNQEINVGDEDTCKTWHYYCPNGGLLANGHYCITERVYSSSPDDCSCTDCSWTNGQCHEMTSTLATRDYCAECISDNYELAGGQCVEKKCFCNSDRTSCVVATQGDSIHTTLTDIDNQFCEGETVLTCCYFNDSGYSIGNVKRERCISISDEIITDATTCNNLNNCTDSTKPYKKGDQCVACNGANEYKVNQTCVECPANYVTDAFHNGECYINVPSGKYLVSATTGATAQCAKGSYSSGGVYYKEGGDSSLLSCTSCGEGKTTLGEGATSVNQCVVDCATLSETQCRANDTLCAWNEETNTCVDAEKEIQIVGAEIMAYVTPEVCKTYTLSVKYKSGVTATGNIEWTVSGDDSHNCSGNSCSVRVCGKGCLSNPSVKVTAKLGDESATVTITRAKYREWSQIENWSDKVADTQNEYIYNSTALDNNTCVGYSDPIGVDANGKTIYAKKWTRCCGNGQTTYKCYEDENGVYHWSSSPESSWVVVTKTEPECKNEDACFETPDGRRVWGKYYAQIVEGYKLITTIGDDDLCEHPSEEEACYVKDGDYKWSATALEGYTVVYTKAEGDASDCQPELCYINVETDKLEFGKFDGDSKYVKYIIDDEVVKDVTQCKKPDEEEACYEDADGTFVWGAHAGDSKYKLVPEITDMSQCVNGKGDIPVPATGISISKIIYIFMAILMACGVGFIYYSSVVKKNEAE